MEEKRKFARRELEDLSARLFKADSGVEIDFFPINVSQGGFSIFTSSSLAAQTKLILSLQRKDVELIVRWCRPKENDPAVFRCGLERTCLDDHLDALIKEELSY